MAAGGRAGRAHQVAKRRVRGRAQAGWRAVPLRIPRAPLCNCHGRWAQSCQSGADHMRGRADRRSALRAGAARCPCGRPARGTLRSNLQGPLLSARFPLFFSCFAAPDLSAYKPDCLCKIMLGWRCLAAARLCHARHAPNPIRTHSSAPMLREALHPNGPSTSSKRFRLCLVTPERRPA